MGKLLEEKVVLRCKTIEGESLEAQFVVSNGMNLVSFKKGETEAIDQSIAPLFEERAAGLGAMIGPHFHHRTHIPPVPNEALFPHIAILKAKGVKEPFSHGIGRYASWKVTSRTEASLQAVLTGNDEWKGVKLETLEGQNFTMHYQAELTPQGLKIHLSTRSEEGSLVGLHTYYALHGNQGKILTKVQGEYRDKEKLNPIPSTWNYGKSHELVFDLKEECDYGFFPFPGPLGGSILLEAGSHRNTSGLSEWK